ncbi:hypothetical protein Btru_040435 [Bulinus truncatus]|nr:hypothetical protein Btru_040435 [Bulinus truncatus]
MFCKTSETLLRDETSRRNACCVMLPCEQSRCNDYVVAAVVFPKVARRSLSTCSLDARFGAAFAVTTSKSPAVIRTAVVSGRPDGHNVLEVVRGNYDTLTLKLQDSLDQFERYSEKPREMAFFTNQILKQPPCHLSHDAINHLVSLLVD